MIDGKEGVAEDVEYMGLSLRSELLVEDRILLPESGKLSLSLSLRLSL